MVLNLAGGLATVTIIINNLTLLGGGGEMQFAALETDPASLLPRPEKSWKGRSGIIAA